MSHFKIGALVAAACAAFVLFTSPLQAQTIGTGAFVKTAAIEKELRRGISTKTDVQKLLGIPTGTGQLNWMPPPGESPPPLGAGPRNIWFYNDMQVTDMEQSEDGTITMKSRMQILLVFFKGDLFDGYLRSSNVFTPTATQ